MCPNRPQIWHWIRERNPRSRPPCKRPPRAESTTTGDGTDFVRLAWIETSWIIHDCRFSYSRSTFTRHWRGNGLARNDTKVTTVSNSSERLAKIILTFFGSDTRELEASSKTQLFWIRATYSVIERLPFLRECNLWRTRESLASVTTANKRVAVIQTSHAVRASVNEESATRKRGDDLVECRSTLVDSEPRNHLLMAQTVAEKEMYEWLCLQ